MSSRPTCIFALTLAYHIWRMGLSPWHHTCSQCLPLTSGSMTWLLCSGHRFFVIPYWHMKVSPWDNESHTFMTSVWPLPLASISKLYFHHEFVWTRSSWLYDVGIPNLAHKCITRHVMYIHDLCMTFDLKVNISTFFLHGYLWVSLLRSKGLQWAYKYVGGEDILASALYLNEKSEHQ